MSYDMMNTQLINNMIFTRVVPYEFVFRPLNDLNHYYTKYQRLSVDLVTMFVNDSISGGMNFIHFNEYEHTFVYRQQYNNQFYQVTCEIISPTLINNILNQNINVFEMDPNM